MGANGVITLTKIRELDLLAPPSPKRPAYLSAASGLVCVHSLIYVVADDELHLGVFGAADNKPGHLIRLFDGELPDSAIKRKKRKPDCEALALLPPHGAYPHGALLAFGSGSRPNRYRGAILTLDSEGAVCAPVQVIDLSALLVPLIDEFFMLNIEGAVVSADELRLFQRGNKANKENAVIRFSLSAALDAFCSETPRPIKPIDVDRFDLGQIDGVPFSFTDAAALPNGDMVFTAVAENTDNAYDDGQCAGAAIGLIDAGGIRWLRRLDQAHKIEGVAARMDGDSLKLLLVTDADDAAIPAYLLSTMIEAP